jgi:hypothetical protein
MTRTVVTVGLVAVAIRLAWGVDGVIDIIDQRGDSRADTGAAVASSATAIPQPT